MKKTMTRILTLALALAMSATMVACNNGGQTSSGSDSSAAESANESAAENNGEEITITYAFWALRTTSLRTAWQHVFLRERPDQCRRGSDPLGDLH